jgi:hypothetical protein
MSTIKRSLLTADLLWCLEGTEAFVHAKRQLRDPLFDAFDLWEKAVLRGREVDDPEIMEWFTRLKDLDVDALQNIPERVQYYLKR